jgi:hypothetical protein
VSRIHRRLTIRKDRRRSGIALISAACWQFVCSVSLKNNYESKLIYVRSAIAD